MNDLPIIGPYINVGGWLAIGALVLVSAIRGWLIPGSQLQRIIDTYERLLEDKKTQIDQWHEAFKNSDARADILAENQRNLLESVKATNAMIQSSLRVPPTEKKETSV